MYLDWKGREKFSTFSSLEAEVIQHEIDHMNGIII
ncbi:MAG: peptide deformylase [Candidatus Ornithospirochaeta sp.]